VNSDTFLTCFSVIKAPARFFGQLSQQGLPVFREDLGTSPPSFAPFTLFCLSYAMWSGPYPENELFFHLRPLLKVSGLSSVCTVFFLVSKRTLFFFVLHISFPKGGFFFKGDSTSSGFIFRFFLAVDTSFFYSGLRAGSWLLV